MFHHKTLANGLQLYVVPMPSTQTATVLVLVKAGSKYETKKINGLSHFLEHMFFKGTTNRPTPLEITETLDRVGGEYNAFTDKERTGYWAKVDARHTELAIDLVADMLINPLLKEDEIEREKGVIHQEISMYYDNPMSHIGTIFEELLYGDQPAGWDIAGTKQIVSNLKKEDFVSYMNDRYVANGTYVVVAGNVKVPKIEKLVSRYFTPLKRGKSSPKKKAHEKQSKPALLLSPKDTDQTHFQIGVRTFNQFDKRRYALGILANILGGNMSSRLFMSLREKHGLAYYVSTRPEYYSDTGYLVTQAGVPNKDIVKAIKVVMDEYEKIKNFKISAEELAKAKDYIRGKTLIGLESSNAMASFVADQALSYGQVKTSEQILKRIAEVTVEDVHKVSKTVFQNNRLNLAIIGPSGKKAQLQKALKFSARN
jgi:predicted Zn-dependent peptidase